MIGSDNASRAGHVLDNDGGISRNMFAEVAGKRARVKIVATASR